MTFKLLKINIHMADSHTVTTRTSYGSRIVGGFKNIVGGMLLLVLGSGLLWWNEGRTVKQHRALNEVQDLVQTVNSAEVQPVNEGGLIHANGTVVTTAGTGDEIFGVKSEGLALQRTVEMYQWDEDEKTETTNNVGGSQTKKTTYTYDTKWEDRAINSSKFDKPEGHQNPNMLYKSSTDYASDATFGAFKFTPTQVKEVVNPNQKVSLAETDLENFPAELTANGKLSAGWFYSADPVNPAVGDYRVRFYQSPASVDASVIAQQQGNGLVPFTATNGNEIQLIKSGSHTADEMVESAQKTNTMIAWGLRALGVVLLMISFAMIFSLFSILASVLPFMGRLTGALTGFLAGLLGFALGFIIIAMAWVAYRPVLGVSLLAAAALVIVLVIFKSSNRPPAEITNTAQPPTPQPGAAPAATPSATNTPVASSNAASAAGSVPVSGGLTFNIPGNNAAPVATTPTPTTTPMPAVATAPVATSAAPLTPASTAAAAAPAVSAPQQPQPTVGPDPMTTPAPPEGSSLPAPWDQK